jgi:hypothetical protein
MVLAALSDEDKAKAKAVGGVLSVGLQGSCILILDP